MVAWNPRPITMGPFHQSLKMSCHRLICKPPAPSSHWLHFSAAESHTSPLKLYPLASSQLKFGSWLPASLQLPVSYEDMARQYLKLQTLHHLRTLCPKIHSKICTSSLGCISLSVSPQDNLLKDMSQNLHLLKSVKLQYMQNKNTNSYFWVSATLHLPFKNRIISLCVMGP